MKLLGFLVVVLYQVSEEVERALVKLGPAKLSGRVSPQQIAGPGGSNLLPQFRSKLALPLLTGGKSIEQIGNRADRMRIGTEELFLYSSTDVEDILEKLRLSYFVLVLVSKKRALNSCCCCSLIALARKYNQEKMICRKSGTNQLILQRNLKMRLSFCPQFHLSPER